MMFWVDWAADSASPRRPSRAAALACLLNFLVTATGAMVRPKAPLASSQVQVEATAALAATPSNKLISFIVLLFVWSGWWCASDAAVVFSPEGVTLLDRSS
jgi:hypothetical protein